MQIRPFTDEDYAGVTRLFNLMYCDFAKDVEEFKIRDRLTPEWCRWQRWSAVDRDQGVVGYAEYHNSIGTFDPHQFGMELTVDPACQGHGIGQALYATILEALESLNPLTLASWSREDMPRMKDFLSRRGFVPDSQLLTSCLDLTRFDPTPWLPRVSDVLAQGVRFVSLEELGPKDEGVRHALFDMWTEVRQDLPMPPGEVRVQLDYAEYVKRLDVPSLFPAGYFVALDGDRYVGTSQLFSSPVVGELRTGLTGVRRAYRRRGIAFALKVHALSFAAARGYRRVLTENAAENVGMLAINCELGFERNPPWIHYLKTF